MISTASNVILVDAQEPTDTRMASITWTLLSGLKAKNLDDVVSIIAIVLLWPTLLVHAMKKISVDNYLKKKKKTSCF